MIQRLLRPIPYIGIRYPSYFFHHVPKTGGTALLAALGNWFDMLMDYRASPQTPDLAPIDISKMSNRHCVAGHFGDMTYFLDKRYPEVFNGFMAKHKYRCFTFIRAPLAMRCSLYRHQVQINEKTLEMTLFDHLCYKDNYTAAILNVNEENYRQRLDKYFFVGTADNLQISFDALAELLKMPQQTLPVVNATMLKSGMVENSLSDDQIDEFKHRNKLDYLIYDYAKQRLATLLNKK